jgi:WD40 repeat protein
MKRSGLSLLCAAVLVSATASMGWAKQPLPTVTLTIAGGSFSPDGKFFILVDNYQGVHAIYEVAGWKERKPFTEFIPCNLGPPVVPFLPNGRPHVLSIVSSLPSPYGQAEDPILEVRNVVTGEQVRQLERAVGLKERIRSLTISRDGTLALAAGEGGSVGVWDVGTGKYLRTLRSQGAISAVAISAGGRLALGAGSCSLAGTALTVWDVSTGRVVRTSTNDAPLRQWDDVLAFAPVGRWAVTRQRVYPRASAAVGEEQYWLVLWDPTTGQQFRRFHTDATWLAFSPDGRHLLAAEADERRREGLWLREWDLASGRELRPRMITGAGQWVSFAAFTPDGRQLVTVSGSIWSGSSNSDSLTIKVWDAATGKLIRVLREPPPPPPPAWQFWRRR